MSEFINSLMQEDVIIAISHFLVVVHVKADSVLSKITISQVRLSSAWDLMCYRMVLDTSRSSTNTCYDNVPHNYMPLTVNYLLVFLSRAFKYQFSCLADQTECNDQIDICHDSEFIQTLKMSRFIVFDSSNLPRSGSIASFSWMVVCFARLNYNLLLKAILKSCCLSSSKIPMLKGILTITYWLRLICSKINIWWSIMKSIPHVSLLIHSQSLTQKMCASWVCAECGSFMMKTPRATVMIDKVPKTKFPPKSTLCCFCTSSLL